MNNKRVLSMNSRDKVYHFGACRYAKRMTAKRKMEMPLKDAKRHGYRPCKCCNNMAFRYRMEEGSLKHFSEIHGMECKLMDGKVFVKTEIGCWMIIYSEEDMHFKLYHRNKSSKPVDFENPGREKYHRQTDEMTAKTLMDYFMYIYKHDMFRKAEVEAGGNLKAIRIDKKYEKNVRRREQKNRARRVDYLFRKLERENKGMRELSFC